MAKEEKNYTKEFRNLNISMYIIMGLLLLLAIIFMVTSCQSTKTNEDSDYDVSMMRTVGVNDVIDMFNDGETYVLYIGRETCSVCHELLPALQEAQINNNYITQYLDISQVDRSSAEWEELVELLDLETTTTMDEEGVAEEVTFKCHLELFICNPRFRFCFCVVHQKINRDNFVALKLHIP